MRVIEIDRALLKSLLLLVSVIEARDPFTAGHTWRTSRYAKLLAEKAGFAGGDIFLAQLGGLVHDLGKIGIPDALLNKQGRLTPEEYEQIKLHPEIGYRIISNHPLAPLVEKSITQHHLRFDGKGYPAAFAKQEVSEIPLIIAVADAFDAVTSCRPYRGVLALEHAIAMLEAERGKQFHPGFAEIFIGLARKGDLNHIIGHSSEMGMMLACPECGPIIATPPGSRDGDTIDCPSCRGEFRLHLSREAFELEPTGQRTGPYIPRPDTDVVEEVLREAPRKVEVDSNQ